MKIDGEKGKRVGRERKEGAERRVKRREKAREREKGGGKSGVEKMENSPTTSTGLENRRTSHSSIQPSGAMRDLF